METETYGAPLASLHKAAPELLKLVRLFEKTVEYYIRKNEADGDDEGARMKIGTLNTIRATIAEATAK